MTSLKNTKKNTGFSLVELIVVVTIIAILGVVAITYGNNYKLSQYNVRRIDDIKTLQNAMESYMQAKKSMPEVVANTQFYDAKGYYLHAGAGDIFGASSFVTPDTFPREYLQTFPLDPQTNHYYAYGRRYDNELGYEFATVINDGGEYSTYLRGNYDGAKLISLIKEFNGPNFVNDGTTDYLPYNPEELKVTGRVISWSGSVWTDKEKTKTLTSSKQLLGLGDTLVVGTGGLAKISLSDGSELELGSSASDSVLEFNTLKYNENDNLSSSVSSILTMGEVWVRAPKYYKTSNFSITADGQAATVRGTVFGVSLDASSGTKSFRLADGKILVANTNKTIPELPTGDTNAIKKTDTGIEMSVPEGASGVEISGQRSACADGDDSANKGANISPTQDCKNSFSGAIANSSLQQKMNTEITPHETIHSGLIPEILSLENKQDALNITAINIGANEIELSSSGLSTPMVQSISTESGTIISSFHASTQFTGEISLRLCYNPLSAHTSGDRLCSAYKKIILPTGSNISFSGETLKPTALESLSCNSGSLNWGAFGCQDKNLLAYAPYDTSGDIFLYVPTGALPISSIKNIISIGTPISSLGDALNKVIKKDDISSTLQNITQNANAGCSPTPSGTFPWTYFNSICNPSPNISQILQTASGSIDYISKTSFFDYHDERSGIFVSNSTSSPGALVYNLSPIVDKLKDGLTIEIGVRGAALTRLGNDFKILDNDSVQIGINSLGLLQIYSNGGSFIPNKTCNPGGSVNTSKSYCFQIPKIDSSGIYSISLSYLEDKKIISISENKTPIFQQDFTSLLASPLPTASNNLIVGGKKDIINTTNIIQQWNDIISFVKISTSN